MFFKFGELQRYDKINLFPNNYKVFSHIFILLAYLIVFQLIMSFNVFLDVYGMVTAQTAEQTIPNTCKFYHI